MPDQPPSVTPPTATTPPAPTPPSSAPPTPPAEPPQPPAATPPETPPATAMPDDKAKDDAKSWFEMAYPGFLLEEEKAKADVKPLDLSAPATPTAPAAQPKADATPPAATPATPPPAPAPEPVKVTKRKPAPEIEDIVKQTVAATVKATAPPTEPPKAPAEPPKTTDEDLSNWNSDEIRLLRTAKFAEESAPDKYKGLVEGIKSDKKKLEDYRQKALEADPEWNEGNDEKFAGLVDSIKPRLSNREVSDLEDERLITEAEKRVISKQSQKTEELETQIKELRYRPLIEHQIETFKGNLSQILTQKVEGKPDIINEIATRYNEVGDGIVEESPVYAPIVVDNMKLAEKSVKSLIRFKERLENYQADNPVHQHISRVMDEYDYLTSQAKDEVKTRVINGVPKKFLPRLQYHQLLQEKSPKIDQYWTYTVEEYIPALAFKAQHDITMKIKEMEAILTKAGYKREAPKPADPPKPTSQPPPPQMKPSVPAPSPAPGPGAGATVQQGNALMDEDMMKLLGYS